MHFLNWMFILPIIYRANEINGDIEHIRQWFSYKRKKLLRCLKSTNCLSHQPNIDSSQPNLEQNEDKTSKSSHTFVNFQSSQPPFIEVNQTPILTNYYYQRTQYFVKSSSNWPMIGMPWYTCYGRNILRDQVVDNMVKNQKFLMNLNSLQNLINKNQYLLNMVRIGL